MPLVSGGERSRGKCGKSWGRLWNRPWVRDATLALLTVAAVMALVFSHPTHRPMAIHRATSLSGLLCISG